MAPRAARVPEATLKEVEERASAEREEHPNVQAAKEVFGSDVAEGLAAKMSLVMRAVPSDWKPTGSNKHFRYKFWETEQITGFFRSQFVKLGIVFLVDVESYDIVEHATKSEGRSALTNLLCRFTLIDANTGQTFSGAMLGQGDDPGDKGANKAIAAATKYWLMKVFLIGGEDAEADDATDRRSEEREERKVRIGPSSIEGIKRGGRANKTTDAQIRQVRELARDLNWNATGTARRIAEWLGDDLELPEDVEEHRDALISYLEGLDADDAGTIITKMVEARDTEEEAGEPEREDLRDLPY